jgi:methionyl-tRNA formyltransferase
MKVAFFIHEDYDFSFGLLQTLLPELLKKHRVTGIVSFPDVLTGSTGIQIPLKYLEIFGFPTTARMAARSILNRMAIVTGYLRRKNDGSTFRQLARRYGISYRKCPSPNHPDLVRWVRDTQTDIIFIFIGHILNREILAAPACCVINKHASLLPSNRGVLPVFWAMLKGERIGFSLHKVTEKLDSGEVVYQKEYEDLPLTLYEWYRKIYSDVPQAILSYLDRFPGEGTPPAPGHPAAVPSYHNLPTKEDVRRFYSKGLKIL